MNTISTSPTPTTTPTDLEAVKRRQQLTWASGDYSVIGTRLQIVGETLAEAVGVRALERVLDVAAGNGNATLAAARRYAQVTSTDYVQELLDRGAQRVRADGLDARFQVADAEALPFEDGSFDVALSTFGVMFTPDPPRAARELVRVVRRGGRIGLANWTPDGFVGDLFRVVAAHVPPPPGVTSPMRWGAEARLEELFGRDAASLRCTRRTYGFHFHSAAHWIETFRSAYGPVHKAYAALDAAGQERLTRDLEALLAARNAGGPDALVVPSEYLEVVVTRT